MAQSSRDTSPEECSEYGFDPNEPRKFAAPWSPANRSRTESNMTPNPVQKVSNWMKKIHHFPENGDLGSDCNNCSDLEQKSDLSSHCGNQLFKDASQKLSLKNDSKSAYEPIRKVLRKSRSRAKAIPHYVKTILETDSMSFEVPMSPESQQKRELTNYLQLMKPSDRKQVILLQNRRSKRVKNLCLMQERRELEKKLREEEGRNQNGIEKHFENEKIPKKTWLKYKKKGFEFPKPPSVVQKKVDDFENINLSWVKPNIPLQNGSALSDNCFTLKSNKKSKKLPKTKKKLDFPVKNGHFTDIVNGKKDLSRSKTPKRKPKDFLSKRRSSEINKTVKKTSKVTENKTSNKNKKTSTKLLKKKKKKVNKPKDVVFPKPLAILHDSKVDFDVVMDTNLKVLRKPKNQNSKPKNFKTNGSIKLKVKIKDKKLKSKIKKNKPKNFLKIRLIPINSKKKRKITSSNMDSSSSSPVAKKPKLNAIKKDKNKNRILRKTLDEKKHKKLKDKKRKTANKNVAKIPTNDVFKENQKPENNQEKHVLNKPKPSKDGQTLSFLQTDLFADIPTKVANNDLNKRSLSPENYDFIDEEQFCLLSEEHQQVLIQSRIQIVKTLNRSKPVASESQIFMHFDNKKPENQNNCVTQNRNFILPDDLQALLGDDQDFPGFYNKTPSTKGRTDESYFELRLSPDSRERSTSSRTSASGSIFQNVAVFNSKPPDLSPQVSKVISTKDVSTYYDPPDLSYGPNDDCRLEELDEIIHYQENGQTRMEDSSSSGSSRREISTELSNVKTVRARSASPSVDNRSTPESNQNQDLESVQPLRIEIDNKDQEEIPTVPFKKMGDANSLARSLSSPRRYQSSKTNFETQHGPQRSQTSVFISPDKGSILKAFYVGHNLVLCQEFAVSFWTQTALGKVLGAQNMWIPKGTIQRLVMNNTCIFKQSAEMVVSTETNVAYIELWMKEHESDLRQRPVADVFATVYFWKKGLKGIEKKVLQLENINGFAGDVQYSVLRYSSKIIVSWHTAADPLGRKSTKIHCYDLATDYQTVSTIRVFESVEHYVASLHNVENGKDLIMGCGENNITLWNVEYGYVIATVTMTDIKPPLNRLWVKCDEGFLFLLEQCTDKELRLIAISGMYGSGKKLASYIPPEEYERLKGAYVANGLVIAIYDEGIQCWNAKTGESIVEECQSQSAYISGQYAISVLNNRVYVRHAFAHMLSSDDL